MNTTTLRAFQSKAIELNNHKILKLSNLLNTLEGFIGSDQSLSPLNNINDLSALPGDNNADKIKYMYQPTKETINDWANNILGVHPIVVEINNLWQSFTQEEDKLLQNILISLYHNS